MIKTIVLLLLAQTILANADVIPLLLGQEKSFKLQEKTTVSFSVQLPAAASSGSLFVIASGSGIDFYGPPSLHLLRGYQPFSCSEGPSSTLCVVPSSNLRRNDKFQIDVTCIAKCSPTIKAFVDKDFPLGLDDEISLIIGKNSSQFEAIVEIPKDAKFTELKILATLDNPEEVTDGLHLYVNTGTNVQRPSLFKYQLRGTQIWNDGVGVFLNATQAKPGDTVRILLEGVGGTQVSLTCFSVRNDSRDILPGQRIYDDVKADQSKQYVLDLSDSTNLTGSGDVDVKLVKYVGRSRVLVSPDPSFSKDKVVEGVITQSQTQLTMSATTRQGKGFGSIYYIAVFGYEDSTFMLQASVNHQDFVVLESGIAEVGNIVGTQPDNYIFTFVAKETDRQEDNVRDFHVSLDVITQDVAFGVFRCKSLEVNGTHDCLFNSTQNVKDNPQSLTEIHGITHTEQSAKSLTFSYNIRDCTVQHESVRKCSFLVACYNPNAGLTPANYVLSLWEAGEEVPLQESLPKRMRTIQGEVDQFQFSLADIRSVSSIQFYMTVISGSCLLSAATDRRIHDLSDSGIKVAVNNILIVNQQISKQNYLNVRCSQPSYYSLVAIVLRGSDTSTQYLKLKQGVSQRFFLQKYQTDEFFIQLPQAIPFVMQVVNVKGRVKYEVHPSDLYEVKAFSWQGDQSGYLQISNIEGMYTKNNEFIVRVTAMESDSIFSVVYLRAGECVLQNINIPTLLELPEGEERCYTFNVNSLEDTQIVVASSYLDMTTGDMNVSYTLNGSKEQRLSKRITHLKSSEISSSCSMLHASGRHDCLLELTIKSASKKRVNLVVQNSAGQLELFDGIGQHVSCLMSRERGRNFYYEVQSRKPISIVLRSASHTTYRMIMRFAHWKGLLTENIHYPNYADTFLYYSDTTPIGQTMVVINSNETIEVDQGKGLLILSVFTHNFVEEEVEFHLQIMQHTTSLRPSEVKSGYLEKGQTRRYALVNDGTKELFVHSSTYQVHCLRLDLIRESKVGQNIKEEVIERSLTGTLTIPSHATTPSYIVQAAALSACSFQLSYTPIDLKIFELSHGKMFNLELEEEEYVYFLYYHAQKGPFRVITMGESGALNYKARIIPESAVANIADYITKLEGPWQFSEVNRQQSLLIDPKDGGCTNCYYLIRVSSDTVAAAIMVVHSISSPIVLRQNRLISETLSKSFNNISYSVFRSKAYKLIVDVIYGTLSISVQHKNGVYITRTTNSSIVIPVEFLGQANPRDRDSTHNGTAFSINISCVDGCSYSLVVDVEGKYRRIVDGSPYQIQVNSSEKPSCVHFLVLEQKASTYLLLAADRVSQLRQEIKCVRTEDFKPCANSGDLVLNEIDGSSSKSIELRSQRGYYIACYSLLDAAVDPLNLTVTYSTNNHLRYVPPNSYNFIISTAEQKSKEFELYNPVGLDTMVEVFECSGTANLEATTNYEEFRSNKTDYTEHSRTAGHLVVRLHSKNQNEPMSFVRVRANSSQSVAILKYSYYPVGSFPYSQLSPRSDDITYSFNAGELQFMVSPIFGSKNLSLTTATYTLYLAKTAEDIKASVQCKSTIVYNQSIIVNANDLSTEDIVFRVDFEQFEEKLTEDYFFAGVSVDVDTVHKNVNSSVSNRYHFSYEIIQMSNNRLHGRISSFAKNAKLVLMWIVLPIVSSLILLALSWKWFRLYSRRYTNTVEFGEQSQQVQMPVETQGVGVSVSTNNLVSPNLFMSNPQIQEP